MLKKRIKNIVLVNETIKKKYRKPRKYSPSKMRIFSTIKFLQYQLFKKKTTTVFNAKLFIIHKCYNYIDLSH